MIGEFIFYLKQSVGMPAEAKVKVGDRVRRGMLLAAKRGDKPGANLHASVNGTVLRTDEEKIIIEAEETDFSVYEKLKSDTPIELVEEAGIVGLGGAGFPTGEKLKADLSENGFIIVNAAECEPILSHNIQRIEIEPHLLLRGLEIIMEMKRVKRGVIVIKGCHKKEIECLRQADAAGRFEIIELEDIYPIGEERAVIREVTGILLPPGTIPAKEDMLVLNAETVFRIREAVEERKPLIDKDLTVAGKLKEKPGLVKVLRDVPVGMKVSDVIDLAGGASEEYGEIIMGGPFTGERSRPDRGIRKTTGGLLVTETFLRGPEKIGILVCACGADRNRLEQMAESMGSQVAGVTYCKQAQERNGTYKCENPGRCPGQAGKVLELKKQGAQALLISNCTDCTNTVMACAPKMGLPVYHCTDGALRAVNQKLIRRMHKNENE